jgi:hypothetical protein
MQATNVLFSMNMNIIVTFPKHHVHKRGSTKSPQFQLATLHDYQESTAAIYKGLQCTKKMCIHKFPFPPYKLAKELITSRGANSYNTNLHRNAQTKDTMWQSLA